MSFGSPGNFTVGEMIFQDAAAAGKEEERILFCPFWGGPMNGKRDKNKKV